MKRVNKTLRNAEILNFIAWLKSDIKDKNDNTTLDRLEYCSSSLRWNLRRNLSKFMEIEKDYNEAMQEIQQKYSDDKYSYSEVEKDENGEEQTMRKVKEEFIPEFQKEQIELLNQENDVVVVLVSEDDFINNDKLSFADLDMISVMVDEDEE